MPSDQTSPSEWAMEEARKVYAKQTRATWESIACNRNIDNGHIDRAKTEIIALALDAAVAERDEAIRVLGKAYSIHTELHQITHVCGNQPTCPACEWEQDAQAARDAVKSHPIAREAAERAAKEGPAV